MAGAITKYLVINDEILHSDKCSVAGFTPSNVSTSMYGVQREKVSSTAYLSSRSNYESSALKSMGKVSEETILNARLRAVLPEITGAGVGGVLLLSASVYAFVIGMAGVGFALLGTSIAGIFGSLTLLGVSRKKR